MQLQLRYTREDQGGFFRAGIAGSSTVTRQFVARTFRDWKMGPDKPYLLIHGRAWSSRSDTRGLEWLLISTQDTP